MLPLHRTLKLAHVVNFMLCAFHRSEDSEGMKSGGLILEVRPTLSILLETRLQSEEACRPGGLRPGPWGSLCPLALCPTPSAQGLRAQAHPGQRGSWGPQHLYLKCTHSAVSLDFLSSKTHLFHVLISEIRGS